MTDKNGPCRFFYVVGEDIREAVEAELPMWAGLGVAQRDKYGRTCVFFIKSAPRLHEHKVSRREIALCQRRMWYRYWESLRTIDRMVDDRKRMALNEAGAGKQGESA